MLTRFHKILIAALAVQLVLAVIVLTRGDDSAALKEHPIVSGFDAAKVTRLQVFGNPANKPEAGKPAAKPIDLVKRDANWVLASGFDYPVEQTKVNDVLSPIAKLAASAPIATQASRPRSSCSGMSHPRTPARIRARFCTRSSAASASGRPRSTAAIASSRTRGGRSTAGPPARSGPEPTI